MSVFLFVLTNDEVDQLKIGILSLAGIDNERNDWHLRLRDRAGEDENAPYMKFIVFGDGGWENGSQAYDWMDFYCRSYGCDFGISTGML